MKHLSTVLLIVLLAVVGVGSAFAQTDVVASTSWTGAIAKAAGATSVRVLAPLTLQHPPEYALKPGDVTAVRQAKVVVYAGYERFARKLAETAAGPSVSLIKVQTDNVPSVLEAQAKRVAATLGTTAAYDRWAAQFSPFSSSVRSRVRSAVGDRPVIVQRFMMPFVKWLGLNVVGVFGPADPSPSVVMKLAAGHPAIVIDNYHAPNGKPIAQASKAAYVQLINFPGKDGTRSLEDVFTYDANLLVSAAHE